MRRNKKVLVYDFWAYDIPTEVAKDVLERFGVPYTVRVRRKLRDPTAPEGRYDDWAEIYVDKDELAKCLERKIDEEINGYV